jgi:NADP-dependent 3-hydroxy acid dehydrogenase YdfG
MRSRSTRSRQKNSRSRSERPSWKRAVVTGDGRGIGARIAAELTDAGVQVELTDAGMQVAVSARSLEQIEHVAREIGGIAIQADVSDQAAVSAMVSQVERELGAIDVLVNDAGSSGPTETRPIWEEDRADLWLHRKA